MVLDLPPSLQRISDSTPLDELDAGLAQRLASSSLSAPSPHNSANGVELDLVEVISVDSSDDEDDDDDGSDAHCEIIPLELFVKPEVALPHDRRQAASSGDSYIKYELRPSFAAESAAAAAVVDLCSDDEDDDDDRNSSGSDANTEVLNSDSGDTRSSDSPLQQRAPSSATQYMYEHDWHSSNTIIRFKRHKLQTGRTRLTNATSGIHSSSRNTDTVERMVIDDDDGDDDVYSTMSFSESESDSDNDAMDTDNGDNVSDEDMDMDMDMDEDDSRHSMATTSHTLAREQVNAIILRDVHALEAQKPWRHVYRCLELPFFTDRTTDTFDLLFEQWDAFWRLHGRAVWERYFWAPLLPGSLEYGRRKRRQWRAAQSFRALAADLCAKLGTDFLTPLAHVAHDGWWYRSAPLVLRELFLVDRRKYAMYMKLYRTRFPRGSRFERSLNPEWCLDAALLAERNASRRADSMHKAWQDVASSDDDDDA